MRSDFKSADLHLAARRPNLAQHHADSRAFSRPVVAEQAVNFARWHLEREVVHGQTLAETLLDVFELNHWLGMVPLGIIPSKRFLMCPSAYNQFTAFASPRAA